MTYKVKNVTVGETTTVVKKVVGETVTLVKKIVVGRPIRRVSGSGGSTNINDIIGIDTSGATNGSLLIYNSGTTIWEANKTIEEQIINGGQY